MRLTLCFAALFLVGCDEAPRAWSRDEIVDIADDSAPDTSELEARITELEAQVQQLHAADAVALDGVAGTSKSLLDSGEGWDNSLKRLERNERVVFENLNHLRALRGLPPIPGTTYPSE